MSARSTRYWLRCWPLHRRSSQGRQPTKALHDTVHNGERVQERMSKFGKVGIAKEASATLLKMGED
jgi:hypothetical protein